MKKLTMFAVFSMSVMQAISVQATAHVPGASERNVQHDCAQDSDDQQNDPVDVLAKALIYEMRQARFAKHCKMLSERREQKNREARERKRMKPQKLF
jgi:hypothetical protein